MRRVFMCYHDSRGTCCLYTYDTSNSIIYIFPLICSSTRNTVATVRDGSIVLTELRQWRYSRQPMQTLWPLFKSHVAAACSMMGGYSIACRKISAVCCICGTGRSYTTGARSHELRGSWDQYSRRSMMIASPRHLPLCQRITLMRSAAE